MLKLSLGNRKDCSFLISWSCYKQCVLSLNTNEGKTLEKLFRQLSLHFIQAELELVIRLYVLRILWCSSCHDGLLIFTAFEKSECPNVTLMQLSGDSLFTNSVSQAP